MKPHLFRSGLVIYGISMIAFMVEFLAEVTGYRFFYIAWQYHEIIEIMILVGFLSGAYLVRQGVLAMRARNAQIQSQLNVASGAFQEAIEQLFLKWSLSEAEREVALLTIKGMSISEIAGLRQTTEGTIKAQSSAIYKKAGVGTRAQLVSSLIEELLE